MRGTWVFSCIKWFLEGKISTKKKPNFLVIFLRTLTWWGYNSYYLFNDMPLTKDCVRKIRCGLETTSSMKSSKVKTFEFSEGSHFLDELNSYNLMPNICMYHKQLKVTQKSNKIPFCELTKSSPFPTQTKFLKLPQVHALQKFNSTMKFKTNLNKYIEKSKKKSKKIENLLHLFHFSWWKLLLNYVKKLVKIMKNLVLKFLHSNWMI